MFVALAWGALARWLTEYEDYAHETLARGRRLAGRRTRALPLPRPRSTSLQPPRRLLGVVCESRPPPLPA